MSLIDKQLVTRKAKLIEEDLAKLEDFEAISLEQYLKSLEARLQVERLLERIIGRVIDINYHILREEFKIIPNDYFQSFMQLGEKGIISKDFAEEIAASTGLRNALAHEYDTVDSTLVYASIKKCLREIPKYLSQVLEKYSK
ncbi:MAG: DUF86 domain-containing protein [Candidatus Blackburnbacteria bacterium]|nr:DUF86 domain-containing protein [Candidatus Blackburnbacteria bacterium]